MIAAGAADGSIVFDTPNCETRPQTFNCPK